METTQATKTQPKKKTQLSFIIRDTVEKLNRSGINCIKFEHSNSSSSSPEELRLFTAGRDSIIRVYNNLTSASSSVDNSSSNADRFYQTSLSHHTDWVNDIVLCKDSKILYSASSDTTVKVWNANKGTLLNTLRLHKDYVKCLSYAHERGDLIASAGFDKNIFIWDVSTGVALNPSGSLDNQVKNINDNKYSVYSLAMNGQGTLLASGSPENCIRIWDPRTCQKAIKLKGHTHNIRAILLNNDGTQCLSASSDHTIRLWSLGQQRCISTIEIHTEGVWSLCVNDSFNKVYSAGKDCHVYLTDLHSSSQSSLICEEAAPVLSMDFGHNTDSLWIATTNSTIKNWSLKPIESTETFASETSKKNKHQSSSIGSVNLTTSEATDSLQSSSSILLNTNQINTDKSSSSSLSSSFLQMTPLNTQPLITIKGTASIKQYSILNDKRTIVTKDSDENVCVWDVLQARKLESLGKENYENVIKQRQRFISIPNWFSVDLKLGLLTITLDENEWHSAWVNFKDMDSNHVRGTQNIDLTDAKVNYGCIFLESLFKNCLFINPLRVQTCSTVLYSPAVNSNKTTTDEEQNQAGLLRFNIPDHIPIIFSEVSGRTLHRTEVKELSKESEQETLSQVMPLWIIDPLVNKNLPKFNRLVFILNPYNSNPLQANSNANKSTANKDRLSSIDLLQVKKLKEHVYQKILKLDENPAGTDPATSNTSIGSDVTNPQQKQSVSSLNGSTSSSVNDLSAIANRTIELICSDTILNDSEMNLRTLKHLIWKGIGDLTILYRVNVK